MNAKRHLRDLVLLPLGGAGEIGMNCYAYGSGPPGQREWLLVDLGVKFGEESEPGIDVVLPDLAFIEAESRRRLSGLVLTHAHEDHIGAVPWLWRQLQCPIWCTPFCAELLAGKFREAGFDDDEVPMHVHDVGSRFRVGSFDCEFIGVTHSIPESCALLIATQEGRVLHSGDWKIDGSPTIAPDFDERRLREIGGAGVDALICDSTNVLREGFSPSEADVGRTIAEIVAQAPRRVAITTFASHVGRIVSAIKAARAAGREIVVAGRAMRRTIEAARACGYLKDAGTFLEEEAFGYLPPANTLLLCTGSQGEPRAAIARIGLDEHPHISLEEGDIVIFSSRTIPGNEKEVGAVLNNLARLGVDLITADEALVHTSGHPRRGELKTLYDLVKPGAVIPVHGEPRHLRAHAALAKAFGISHAPIVENGQVVRLAPGPAEVIDEAHAGRLHVDGRLIVPAEDGPAKARRKLSFSGIVLVSIAIDGRGELADCEIVTDGLPAGMEDMLRDAAGVAFAGLPKPRRKDDATLREALRVAVRRAAEAEWGKKPVVRVALHRG
jgi:ribonuclease J